MNFFNNVSNILSKYSTLLLKGLGYTMLIALIGTIIGLVIGLCMGIIRTIPTPKRKAWSIVQKCINVLINVYVEIFRGSEIFEELEEAAGGKKLVQVMEMDFLRKSIQVDTGASISVISVDEGMIRTAKGDAAILEVEVELYSGNQEDMIALSEELADKYNLIPCDVSKYQRGLELLGLE